MVCVCEGRGCTAQTAEGYPLPQFSLDLDSINWANNIPSAIHVLSQRKVFQNGYKREPRTNFNTEICCMLFWAILVFYLHISHPMIPSLHWGPKIKTKQSSSGLPKTHFWTKIFHIWSAFSLYPDMGAMGTLWTKKPKLSHLRHILFTNFWYVMTFSLCLHMGSLGIKIRITQS